MAYLARYDPRFSRERVTLHVPTAVVALFCREPASGQVLWDPSIRALGWHGALQSGLVLQPWPGIPAFVSSHQTRCPEWELLREVLGRSWASRAAAEAMADWEAEVDRREPPVNVGPVQSASAAKKSKARKKHRVGVFFAPLETLGEAARVYRDAYLCQNGHATGGGVTS